MRTCLTPKTRQRAPLLARCIQIADASLPPARRLTPLLIGAAGLVAPITTAQAQTFWNYPATAPQNGDFNTASNWLGGLIPTASTNVANNSAGNIVMASTDNDTINRFDGTGAGTLTLNDADLTVNSSFISAAAVTLNNGADLTVGGSLTVSGGLYLDGQNPVLYGNSPNQYAIVQDATILNTSVTLTNSINYYPWAQLSNVTLDAGSSLNTGQGTIELTNTATSNGALQFTNAALAQPGGAVINIQSGGQILVDATSLNPNPVFGSSAGLVTVNMDNSSLLGGYGMNGEGTQYGTGFTIGSDVSITASRTCTIGAYSLFGEGLTNDGTINANSVGAQVSVQGGDNHNVVNNGTIEATNSGASVSIGANEGSFTNNGALNISNGGSISIESASNIGTVTIDSNKGSTLYVNGYSNGQYPYSAWGTTYTPANFAGIQAQGGSGGVCLQGEATLNIGGGTFDPTMVNAGGSTAFGLFHLSEGAITNGTIVNANLLQFEDDNTTIGGILHNVSLQGNGGVVLNLTNSNDSNQVNCYASNLVFASGSIFNIGTVATGGTAALLLFNDNSAAVTFAPTSGTAIVNLGTTSTNGYIGFAGDPYGNGSGGKSLTIGSGVTIYGTGGVGANPWYGGGGTQLINDGTIDATIAGVHGGLTVSSGSDDGSTSSNVTNNGTIEVTASGTPLSISSGATGSVTNTTNAEIGASGGGTATITGGSFVNQGMVYVGAGSTLNLNSTASSQTSGLTQVDGTLNINNATNTYSLSGGAISGSSLTGSGTINGNVNAVSTNVLPGDSVAGVVTPGRLTINGNYSQTGGEFEAALGSSTSYSQLSVSGTATVGGAATIGVELYNGFVPTVGESFGVIAGSSVSAAWTNPTSGLGLISDSTGGYDFKVSDTAAAVSLIYEGVAGSSATVPVLPSSTVGQGFLFENLQNGVWIDPTLTSGYELQTTNGALFTSIVLPSGYSDPFVITVGNALLGDYGPGSTVNFSSIYPGGVSEFTITGIHPEVDSSDPDAFAVQTYFNESGADVEMTPFSGSAAAPEPAAVLLLTPGALVLLGAHRRRKRKIA